MALDALFSDFRECVLNAILRKSMRKTSNVHRIFTATQGIHIGLQFSTHQLNVPRKLHMICVELFAIQLELKTQLEPKF